MPASPKKGPIPQKGTRSICGLRPNIVKCCARSATTRHHGARARTIWLPALPLGLQGPPKLGVVDPVSSERIKSTPTETAGTGVTLGRAH